MPHPLPDDRAFLQELLASAASEVGSVGAENELHLKGTHFELQDGPHCDSRLRSQYEIRTCLRLLR